MIHINLGQDLNFEEVTFEIYLGNQIIERRRAHAPEDMLKMMFMSYCEQLYANRPQPMCVKMLGEEQIWSEFDNTMKVIPKSVCYWNYNYEGEI